MSVCFASLEDSVLFENLVKLLDLKCGHQKKIVFNLVIENLRNSFFFFFFFLSFLLNGGCKTDKVLSEWLTLKSYMCRLSQIIKI